MPLVVKGTTQDGIHRWLRVGWEYLRHGRPWDALDVFGRILLSRPQLPAARRGLERARRALAEEERLRDVYRQENPAVAGDQGSGGQMPHAEMPEISGRPCSSRA